MLSRRSDYIEGNEPKLQQILKVNKDGSLSAANTQKFNLTIRILNDNNEEFPIEYSKY